MDISEFQDLMRTLFLQRDEERGVMKTFAWLVEEVGELAAELRELDPGTGGVNPIEKGVKEELADVFAWLCSISNLVGVDLEAAALEKYPFKCNKCDSNPCHCGSK